MTTNNRLNVTITFLEMAKPPEHQAIAPPLTEGLSLVRVQNATTGFYRYLYNNVGEAWLWSDRRRLNDLALIPLLRDPNQFLLVAYLDGEPAGFSELVAKNGVCDIAYFGLMPHALGRKLGPWLLDITIRTGWNTAGTEKMTVNTCSFDHPRALPLYQDMGFYAVRQEQKMILDPRCDGILPKTAAPHIPLAAA